jgi:hypothetical protein
MIFFNDVENLVLDTWDYRRYPIFDYLLGYKKLACKPWLDSIKVHLHYESIELYTEWVVAGGGDDYQYVG